jgi:LuxR family transcriptional regulator, activator of conjugal transfer of Ti plasmids
MRPIEHVFQEFIDAIQTAADEPSFERVAGRVTHRLGFRWFAYLRIADNAPTLMSSYPKSWTSRYFALNYQQLDPVVRRARLEHGLFDWGGASPAPSGTREQRKFFEEATTFGIRSGMTVPIRGGFGRMAAFTLATDNRSVLSDQFIKETADVVQLIGLYFHTHLTVKLSSEVPSLARNAVLTQRERQCLMWASRGKTVADIAILVEIKQRTVAFHLGNARRKLGASSTSQCIAEALRCGLLR